MSGPNPPEAGSGDADYGVGHVGSEFPPELVSSTVDDPADPGTAFSQAYSAPESEQFLSGPYVPMDPRLYDYDTYDTADEPDPYATTPRWPWVVGVTVIIAAISLVVSVALLFARTETRHGATPSSTSGTVTLPPVQDEITKTTTTPPPPPSSEEPPPSKEEPAPPPTTEEPSPEPSTTTPESTTTTTTQAKPMQVTYSVTGTKAPFDQITITYVDASGQRRTQRNAYIPWSLTLTPISQSEIGSVEASSMLRLSKLNCSITSSDGRVLSSNSNDAPVTSC